MNNIKTLEIATAEIDYLYQEGVHFSKDEILKMKILMLHLAKIIKSMEKENL